MAKIENPARAVTRSYRSVLQELDAQPTAIGLFEAGEAARRIGDHVLAESLFRRCLNAAHGAGDKSTMAWGLWGLATLRRLAGEFDDAVVAYELSADCATEAENVDCLNWARAGQAEIIRHRREHASALEHHEHLLQSFRQAGDDVGELWALQGIGQIHLVNAATDADDFFRKSEDLAREIGDLRAIGFSRRALGMSARLRGDIPGARALLDEAGQIFQTLEYQVGIGFVARELAHCAIIAGDTGEAERLIRGAIERFGNGFPLGRAWALATLAQVQKEARTLNESTLLHSARLFKTLGVRVDVSEPQACHVRRFFASGAVKGE